MIIQKENPRFNMSALKATTIFFAVDLNQLNEQFSI